MRSIVGLRKLIMGVPYERPTLGRLFRGYIFHSILIEEVIGIGIKNEI